jgi:transposase-like protein
MQGRYHERNLMNFFTTFATEEACERHLMKMRWPDGMPCLQCGKKEFYPRLKDRRAYQCHSCRFFNRPTAGTIFHRSKISLQHWFVALFLCSFDKRGLSALLLAEQLGVHYETAWAMLQRVRHAMAKRDKQYKLSGYVEMDEMYVGAPTEAKKRGRGTEKTPVLVAVSYVTGKDGEEYMGFAKMRSVKTIDGPTAIRFAEDVIESGSTIRTDGLSVFPSLEEHGFIHDRNPVKRRKAHVVLPHVHTYISNLKAFIQGTHHGLDETHLQQYLDEFCYRFNRRRHRHEMFDRLLLACLEKEETPLSALTR